VQSALVETAGRLEAAQESLHGYIGTLTAGVENERRSLARELHDDTLQALIALNQNAQMAALRTTQGAGREAAGRKAAGRKTAGVAEPVQNGAPVSAGGPKDEAAALAELQARIAQTITNLRRVIGGLRPIYLEDLGLVAALGMLVREAGAAPPEISLTLDGEERRLPPEVELALYRIAQEGLNNALHHAQAHHIQLALAFAPAQVTLSVRDDGQGFRTTGDPNAFARQGHFGLLGMRERADLVEAKLEIESSLGVGTSLTVAWEEEERRGDTETR
jgi:signal transduction histidine kinase